ncbi:MAG: xanthine dehydrogenase family protein molybdopterin-binding subunit [Acidimicrobiales bacterium]
MDSCPAEAIAGVTVVRDGGLVGVVADDPATARKALATIDAEWDEPPPITQDLVDYLRSHPLEGGGGRQQDIDDSVGDVADALRAATATVTATFTTAYLAHVPLETRAAVAEWDGGRVTVWVGTQMPFGVRSRVASALGIDEVDVRAIVPPTGGAFGGKHAEEASSEAAILARATGRPVKVHWSRAEELRWGTVRPMAVIDATAALGDDGELVAWDFLNINSGDAALVPPYRIAARRLRYQPAENPLRRGSYRALAATANNFARESVIDELAHRIGEDPLEFRLTHLADERLAAVLRTATERFDWSSPLDRSGQVPRPAISRTEPAVGSLIGRGLAVGLEKGGRVATCAEVEVDPDGWVVVTRVLTAYDCGTVVNPDTVVNQIEGATMMALGGCLLEAVPLASGRLTEPSLSCYPLPRFRDVPEMEVVLCDRPDLPSAGAGETPMIAVAPAVANALFDATGRRLCDLPLTPGRRLPSIRAG